jgi:CheY-like chemotaxis protein
MDMEERERKKILLIDDDTSLLVTLSDFLNFEGYDVVTAESGEQGLKKLAKFEPDLIILDISMAGMGGVGFLKAISEEGGRRKYPVLVLTARANMAEFFADVAVDGFVAKPCDPSDLLMEINRIVFLTSGQEHGGEQGEAPGEKKVLIGEDDRSLAERLVAAFGKEGYAAQPVGRGPDMIEQAVLHQPHVIVMKQMFSNMNGDAVVRILRDMPQTAKIPVVLYDDSGVDLSRSEGETLRVVRSQKPAALVAAAGEMLAAKPQS